MSPANPTWYDILGVDRDASPEQIKAAWREATDKFEPGAGSGQFRLFSEAADVLLDAQKRAEYDDSLAPVEPSMPAVEPSAPVVELSRDQSDGFDYPLAPLAAQPSAAESGRDGRVVSRLSGLSTLSVSILAGLAVVALALAGVAGTKLVLKADAVSQRADATDAGSSASAAAERGLVAVLGYDYRRLTTDRDQALKFLTPKYQADYKKTFQLLANTPDGKPGNAVKTKAVVVATVRNVGVIDATTKRVRLLAFVDQASTKGSGDPVTFQNRVVVTMVKSGDAWLIDALKPY